MREGNKELYENSVHDMDGNSCNDSDSDSAV
jgi:hypothetical protein